MSEIEEISQKYELVQNIIREAGSIVMKYADCEKLIQHKSSVNLLTQADQESEEFIFNSLREEFPEDSILAEEGSQYKGESGYTWIVDPLDGTTSFAHNFPMFAVSIGLVDQNQKSVLGAVYNPYFDELFHAIKGRGSFLNERQIKVSSVQALGESLIGTGFPYTRKEIMETLLQRLEKILVSTHGMRRTGSAALDICFVGAGRYDGYYEEGLRAWDMAAAVLIASEAGAKVSKFNGQEFDLFDGEILVSNKKIHEGLKRLLE